MGAILAGRSDITDLSALADIADVVHDVNVASAAAATTAVSPSINDTVTVAELQQEVHALRRDLQECQARGNAPSSPAPRPVDITAEGLCWFHDSFGKCACNC